MAIWTAFKPSSPNKSVADKYQFLSKVKTYEVPQDEVFSEEVDTVYYDRLGIQTTIFKPTKFLKEQQL